MNIWKDREMKLNISDYLFVILIETEKSNDIQCQKG